MAKYLPMNVLVTAGYPDCTNGGVSTTHSLFFETPEGIYTREEIESWEDGYGGKPVKIMELVKRNIGGEEYMSFKPEGDERWLMMGGNFAYSSDSRFRRIAKYPVPIHDRHEG